VAEVSTGGECLERRKATTSPCTRPAEDLLEIIMRRCERFSTLLTSNRPVDDWGKLIGDVAAVSAMLDRLLHHGHALKCGPRGWGTKTTSTNSTG